VLLNQGGDLHQLDIQQKTPWDYVKGDMHCEKTVEQHFGRCVFCAHSNMHNTPIVTLCGLEDVDRESFDIIKSKVMLMFLFR